MSDDAQSLAPAAEAAPAPPAPRRRGLVKIAVALVVLGGLGAAGWIAVPRFLKRSPAPAEAKPAPVSVKATVPLGAVVVNLAGESRRYVRVGVSLGVSAVKDVKEVEEAKAQLLDAVIAVLASRNADTLVTEHGREEVKAELIERAHKELALESVVRVYFTEFVIQ
jgi:flagellar basal body-associated protein FliL